MGKKSGINFKFDLNKPTNGTSSIKLRFEYQGKRFVYGTGKLILPELWDNETQLPTTDKDRVRNQRKDNPHIETELQNVTARLTNIKTEVIKYFANKELSGEAVNFEELKKHLGQVFKPATKSKEQAPPPQATAPQPPLIRDLAKEYINGMYSGKKTTKGKRAYNGETIKAYLSFLKMWHELEDHFMTSYTVTEIGSDLESDLHEFFNEVKEYTPNTKGKMIKMLKVIMHDFIETETDNIYRKSKEGKITALSLTDLSYIEKKLDRIIKPTSKPVHIYLNEAELKTIYELNLTDRPHLARARDIFMIGCYTGLRVSDYSRIGPEHIRNGYIEIIMYKTRTAKQGKVYIPTRDELTDILKKWNFKIPPMTSQELGRYIKEIGKQAGITQLVEITEDKGNKTEITNRPKYEMITTHTARRSFATNMFYTGMYPTDIMKITGHEKLETFQKYIVHDPGRELQRQGRNSNERYLKVV